jgi:WGR domain
MMSIFTIRLEACDPYQDRFRSYRIEAGPDLFGTWLVDTTYGRIGSPGRRIRHVAADEAEARRIVRRCLQRRRTAPSRIGVAYQLRELDDAGGWLACQFSTPPMRSHRADVRVQVADFRTRQERKSDANDYAGQTGPVDLLAMLR